MKDYVTDRLYEDWSVEINWLIYSKNFLSKRESKITTCLSISIKIADNMQDELWVYHGKMFYEIIDKGRNKKNSTTKSLLKYGNSNVLKMSFI